MLVVLSLSLVSCDNIGENTLVFSDNNSRLPEEIKGLKVYKVLIDNYNNRITIAVLDNKVISAQSGKQSLMLISGDSTINRQIKVSKIISENDSLIVCKK